MEWQGVVFRIPNMKVFVSIIMTAWDEFNTGHEDDDDKEPGEDLRSVLLFIDERSFSFCLWNGF